MYIYAIDIFQVYNVFGNYIHEFLKIGTLGLKNKSLVINKALY